MFDKLDQCLFLFSTYCDEKDAADNNLIGRTIIVRLVIVRQLAGQLSVMVTRPEYSSNSEFFTLWSVRLQQR